MGGVGLYGENEKKEEDLGPGMVEGEDSSQHEFFRIRSQDQWCVVSSSRSLVCAFSQVKLMPAGPLRKVQEGDVLHAIVLMQ